jgi:rsbT antagonist protein RsbS
MSVAVLRQGQYLIASIQSDLSDSQVLALRDDLAERVGCERLRGVVVDISALDVMDSFVARSLRSIALTTNLRGVQTVLVGIQPDVAIAVVQFNLDLYPLRAVLDLDEAVALLDRITGEESADGG